MRPHILFLVLAAVPLRAETRQVVPDHYYRTFAHTNPVLQRIRPGDVIITKTLDSGGQNYRGEQSSEGGNPLTGPFYIEGAEPGDAILVKLQKVRLNRNWGSTAYRLGLFALTPEYIETTYPNHYKPDVVRKGRDNVVPWDIDLEHDTVRLREPEVPPRRSVFLRRSPKDMTSMLAPSNAATAV